MTRSHLTEQLRPGRDPNRFRAIPFFPVAAALADRAARSITVVVAP